MEKEKAQVIDFFDKKRSLASKYLKESSVSSSQNTRSFEEICRDNLLKEEKLKKQRQLDNEKVLKAYKIKK